MFWITPPFRKQSGKFHQCYRSTRFEIWQNCCFFLPIIDWCWWQQSLSWTWQSIFASTHDLALGFLKCLRGSNSYLYHFLLWNVHKTYSSQIILNWLFNHCWNLLQSHSATFWYCSHTPVHIWTNISVIVTVLWTDSHSYLMHYNFIYQLTAFDRL